MVAKFASCQSGSERVGLDRRFHLASVVRFGGWITAREQRARSHEPGSTRESSRVEQHFRATRLFPHVNPAERALVRSQSGPGAGVPFLTSPSSPLTRIEAPLFRVLGIFEDVRFYTILNFGHFGLLIFSMF